MVFIVAVKLPHLNYIKKRGANAALQQTFSLFRTLLFKRGCGITSRFGPSVLPASNNLVPTYETLRSVRPSVNFATHVFTEAPLLEGK